MIKPEVLDQYEPTIGIECHVQLNTKTKLFSGASNDERGKQPNEATSPICFGLPGTLPVLNAKAVELAVRAGKALNAEIAKVSSFDRKHYFYPDLPKGYQITQLDRPTVGKGEIEVPVNGNAIKVRINRAHLEEDAGKLTHPSGADYSLVDLNRAGTPLLEIVSEADMHSAAEAKAYAQELFLLMKYAGVTLGDLQHGNMRFDVNISVAKKGAKEWGRRVEIKNLNSFRAVERAVQYEITRHVELIEKGEEVKQETRGWDEAKQRTTAQRSKEEAMDYRYFPEPDIPPIVLTDEEIEAIHDEMPHLPPHIRRELARFGIDQSTAETLILHDAMTGSGYVHTVMQVGTKSNNDAAKFTAAWLTNRDIKHRQDNPDQLGVPSDDQFMAVYEMVQAKEISSNGVDQLLFKLKTDHQLNAREVAEAEGLLQENDSDALAVEVGKVMSDPANQRAVDDIKKGEMKAIGFLVGQVMKATGGKANPAVVSQMIRESIKG